MPKQTMIHTSNWQVLTPGVYGAIRIVENEYGYRQVLYLSNNAGEEIDGRWNPTCEPWRVKQIVILNDIVPTSLSFFSMCQFAKVLTGLDKIDTSNITDMSRVFDGCGQIKELPGIDAWDTSNVVDMSYMFHGCSELRDISPLAGWDVSNVKTFESMFEHCSSLLTEGTATALTEWDVSSAEDMTYMFCGVQTLSSANGLAKWDTSKVENMRGMFSTCLSLNNIKGLSGWDTSSVTTMSAMFHKCTKLKSLEDLSNWDMESVENMNGMLSDCCSLVNADPILDLPITENIDVGHIFFNATNISGNIPAKFSQQPISVHKHNICMCRSVLKDKPVTLRLLAAWTHIIEEAENDETAKEALKAYICGVPLDDILA